MTKVTVSSIGMLRALILAGLALTALTALPAKAHNAGVSTSRLAIRGRTVSVEINALGADYEKAAGVRLIEAGSGVVNAVALAVMAPSVLTYVSDHVAVLANGQACSRTAATARPADTHVLVTIAWTCPSGGGNLRYHVTLFQDVDPAARHVAVIATQHGEREFVLDRTAPEIDLSGAGSSTLQPSEGSFAPASSTSFPATITSRFSWR